MRANRAILLLAWLLLVVVFAVFVVVMLWSGVSEASAVNASPSPTADAATLAKVRHTADLAQARYVRAFGRYADVWFCFHPKAKQLATADLVGPNDDCTDVAKWRTFIEKCQRRTKALKHRRAVLRRRMKHPNYGALGAKAWLPLLRWEGWPSDQLYMAVRVITRESGGNPNCVGGAGGAYYGLFQLYRGFNTGGWDMCNPVVNVRLALQLYHRLGWQPWACTAY